MTQQLPSIESKYLHLSDADYQQIIMCNMPSFNLTMTAMAVLALDTLGLVSVRAANRFKVGGKVIVGNAYYCAVSVENSL